MRNENEPDKNGKMLKYIMTSDTEREYSIMYKNIMSIPYYMILYYIRYVIKCIGLMIHPFLFYYLSISILEQTVFHNFISGIRQLKLPFDCMLYV